MHATFRTSIRCVSILTRHRRVTLPRSAHTLLLVTQSPAGLGEGVNKEYFTALLCNSQGRVKGFLVQEVAAIISLWSLVTYKFLFGSSMPLFGFGVPFAACCKTYVIKEQRRVRSRRTRDDKTGDAQRQRHTVLLLYP